MKIRRIPADTVPPSMTWQDALRAAKAYWRAKRQQFNKDFQKWKIYYAGIRREPSESLQPTPVRRRVR